MATCSPSCRAWNTASNRPAGVGSPVDSVPSSSCRRPAQDSCCAVAAAVCTAMTSMAILSSVRLDASRTIPEPMASKERVSVIPPRRVTVPRREGASVLLGIDEYPLHQITAGFAGVAGADPSWNDGHYICVCDQAGTVCLTSNLRLYSNNDVMDGFVCIRHDGKQHNIRVSRRLRPAVDELRVGPLRLEILEPMRTVRLVLDDNAYGIALDVTCRSTTVPYEDPVEVTRLDGRLVSERMTYELTGSCEGWVEVADRRHELALATSSFFRNHSWGLQAGRGGPKLYAAPSPGTRRRAPGVRQWVLFDMPDHGGFYFLDPSGRRASAKGALMFGDRTVAITDVETNLQFYDGC